MLSPSSFSALAGGGFLLLLLTTAFNYLEANNHLPHSQCHNQFDIDYGTLDNFTDHMCLFCLDTMISRNSPAWRNSNIVNQDWHINITARGNLIFTHFNTSREQAFRLSYRDLQEAVKRKGEAGHFVLKQFVSTFYMDTFLDCCQDAHDCCRRMTANPSPSSPGHPHCPTYWDGWSCWEAAPPGTDSQTCPDMTEYLLGYLPPRFERNDAFNHCDGNGHWHTRWNTYYWRHMGHADYSHCSSLKVHHQSLLKKRTPSTAAVDKL